MNEQVFHCNIRNMPVAADCTDCLGCPHRLRPCLQFQEHFREDKLRQLGLLLPEGLDYKRKSLEPDIKNFFDSTKKPDITE